MIERPILFQGAMVRALLAGTKTQTRRAIKPQPDSREGWGGCTRLTFKDRKGGLLLDEALQSPEPHTYLGLCPYGAPGDRLWVREAFMHEPADYCWEASVSIASRPASTVYRADFPDSQPGEGWKPSIHMPRKLCRVELEVTAVRVERLHDIREADAIEEGYPRDWKPGGPGMWCSPCQWYADLWKSINGDDSWDANPYVWVVEFRKQGTQA